MCSDIRFSVRQSIVALHKRLELQVCPLRLQLTRRQDLMSVGVIVTTLILLLTDTGLHLSLLLLHVTQQVLFSWVWLAATTLELNTVDSMVVASLRWLIPRNVIVLLCSFVGVHLVSLIIIEEAAR